MSNLSYINRAEEAQNDHRLLGGAKIDPKADLRERLDHAHKVTKTVFPLNELVREITKGALELGDLDEAIGYVLRDNRFTDVADVAGKVIKAIESSSTVNEDSAHKSYLADITVRLRLLVDAPALVKA